MATQLQAYVDIDVTANITMPGFQPGGDTCTLRYTPITIPQEEVTLHMDSAIYTSGDKVNPQGTRPRYLEDMFHPDHYPSSTYGDIMEYQTRFAKGAKVLIGITMYQEACGPPESSCAQWPEMAQEAGTVCSTLDACARNLRVFQEEQSNGVLARFRSDEIVVALTADGRTRINGSADNKARGINNLNSLKSIGAYVEIEELYADDGPLARAGRLTSVDLENKRRPDSHASRNLPKYSVDGGKAVMLHLFEAIIHYGTYPSMNFMFCLKEFNAGKLDSHLWFFDMFAAHFYRVNNPMYQSYFLPDVRQQGDRPPHEIYTVLLDAGTVPDQKAIVELVSCMERDPKVAGCCGEITVDGNDDFCKMVGNSIVACQNFEYKCANFLDKQMQSMFGYIEVLPGAFSAYRWTALSPPELHPTSSMRPLSAYFKSLTAAGDMHPFFENMFLAEDRILCYELVIRGKNRLTYMRQASARTDVPDSLAAFIKQRRRWLNGSQFAIYYAIGKGLFTGGLCAGNHNCIRKLSFLFEFLYLLLNSIVSWFMIGNTFLFSYVFVRGVCLSQTAETPIPIHGFWPREGFMLTIPIYFRSLYMALLLVTLVLALSSRPDTQYTPMRILYKFVAFVYGMITMILCFVMILISYEAIMNERVSADNDKGSVRLFKLCVSISSSFFLGSLFIGGVLHGEIRHVLTCFVQYMFMLPSLLNMVQVFAFCNLHDLSWGTKGLDSGGSSRQAVTDRRNGFRSFMTILWLITNGTLVAVMSSGHDISDDWGDRWQTIETYYLTGIVLIGGAMSAQKLIMSTLSLLWDSGRRLCIRCCYAFRRQPGRDGIEASLNTQIP